MLPFRGTVAGGVPRVHLAPVVYDPLVRHIRFAGSRRTEIEEPRSSVWHLAVRLAARIDSRCVFVVFVWKFLAVSRCDVSRDAMSYIHGGDCSMAPW